MKPLISYECINPPLGAIYEGSLIEKKVATSTTTTTTTTSTTAVAAGEAKADSNDENGMIESQLIFKRIRTKKLLSEKFFGFKKEKNENVDFRETQRQKTIEDEKTGMDIMIAG